MGQSKKRVSGIEDKAEELKHSDKDKEKKY
jgi:hypothetical protein